MKFKERTNLKIEKIAVVLIGEYDLIETLDTIKNYYQKLNHYRYDMDIYALSSENFNQKELNKQYGFIKSIKYINSTNIDKDIDKKIFLMNYSNTLLKNSKINYSNILYVNNTKILKSKSTIDELFDKNVLNLDSTFFNYAYGDYKLMTMFLTFMSVYNKIDKNSRKSHHTELKKYLNINGIKHSIVQDINALKLNVNLINVKDKKVYVVIPFRGSKMRNANLIKVIEYLNKIFYGLNIIIAEHDDSNKIDLSEYDNVTHYFIKCNKNELFNRTGTINYLIKKCPPNSIVINNDCDCIVSKNAYNKAIDLIHNNKYDYIAPYNGIGYNVKNDFRFNRALHNNEKVPRWTKASGGIVMFRKEKFVSIGLENENIISWGYEDFERFFRLTKTLDKNRVISPVPNHENGLKFFNNNKTFEKENLYHFDHNAERDENSSLNPHKNSNKNIAYKVKNMNTDIVKKYISTFPWVNSPSKYDKIERVIQQTYSEYLRGKRVCLVGPAPHMVGSKMKKKIEQYDLIVRLNVALPLDPSRYDDIGSRTNILYNCLNKHKENGGKIDFKYLNSNIEWVACPYPKHGIFENQIKLYEKEKKESGYNINTNYTDTEKYIRLENELGCRPNTGFSAIIDLLNYDIKELYICGITFFKGGYDPSYRSNIDGVEIKTSKQSEKAVLDRMDKSGTHKQKPQIDYMKDLFIKDNRITGDTEFIKIMKK